MSCLFICKLWKKHLFFYWLYLNFEFWITGNICSELVPFYLLLNCHFEFYQSFWIYSGPQSSNDFNQLVKLIIFSWSIFSCMIYNNKHLLYDFFQQLKKFKIFSTYKHSFRTINTWHSDNIAFHLEIVLKFVNNLENSVLYYHENFANTLFDTFNFCNPGSKIILSSNTVLNSRKKLKMHRVCICRILYNKIRTSFCRIASSRPD